MKSASTTSGSGQQREKRQATDTESGMQTGDPLEMGTGESTTMPGTASASTRRRLVVKSEPAAITTQEAVDGYLEKSKADRECRTSRIGQHHGVVNRRSCAQVDKTIKFLSESVAEERRWMEPEESQSLDSCQTPS